MDRLALHVLRAFALLLAVAQGLAAGSAQAARAEVLAGPVPAEVVAVLDGDTLVVRAQIWLGQRVETRVRLVGVDAPELRGACPQERALARRAQARLAALVAERPVVLRDIRFGKYAGRVLARVEAAGSDVGGALLRGGLVRSYDGGGRGDWCGGAVDR